MTETIQHADGRVELIEDALEKIESSPLYNKDLAPVPVEKRNWTTYNYAALWISMAHCIPTYMMASGLISAGMNWWQALITILLGNTIVLAPILLNSHPGTKYGIPFPVFARAAYGTVGSNLPALMRAIVACGWFGIQTWIGGQALQTFFAAFIPGWVTLLGGPIGGHTPTEWLSFLIFWVMNIAIIYKGMDLLRMVENWAAPYVLVMTGLLLGWILYQAGGIGFLLHEPGKFNTFSEFWPIFVPSLTAMVGFWATLSLNMPDFTRFGKSQREQIIGQTVALPTTMVVFAAMGILITSAALIVFPQMNPADAWDPVKLVGQFSQPVVVAISMFTVVVATLSVNIAANVVSPANDFANAFPKLISFRTGGLITGIIGILMQPWKLLADPSGYIFGWLVGYSGGLGSIAGVLIADYWIVRKKNLNLGDLYRIKGEYGGWNLRAAFATLLGCFFAWIGLIIPSLRMLYDYGWFVGFGVAFVIYLLFMFPRFRRTTANTAILFFIFVISSAAHAQGRLPMVDIVISTANAKWVKGKPVPVKVMIENLDQSRNFIVVPANGAFMLNGQDPKDAEFLTMAVDTFWSPVNLNISYGKSGKNCQNDLTDDRIRQVSGTSLISISNPGDKLVLMKGDRRKFEIDLSRTCWNHTMLSYYPNDNLFNLVRSYSQKLSFEMEVVEFDGASPQSLGKLSSNSIDVRVDRK